jgi:hypothetical protein
MVFWGFKTEAAFDVWSVEHLMVGISLASAANFLIISLCGNETVSKAFQSKIQFILVLLTACLWENIEHYLEIGLLGDKITYWFQDVEHWSNRLVFDNIMIMIGWFIYTKQNKLVWFARIFSAVWLFFHIIIFPHSMYLHTL